MTADEVTQADSASVDLSVKRAPARSRDLPVFPLSAIPVRPEVDANAGPAARAVRFDGEAIGRPDGPRVALVTLGCDKNTVDSERMLAALAASGARVTPHTEGADVIVVNTCGFIQAAKEESIGTILDACALKESGKIRAVVAVGCMVERYKEELSAEIPEVDLFLGLGELSGLVPALRERDLLPTDDLPIMERPLRVLSTETTHTSFLKISEGCDHTCAFCAIPLMRGLHRSQPLERLVEEASALGAQGVRELNIISQDTTWYGRDLKRSVGPDAPLLPDLLKALLAGTDVPWYRLFYIYPSGITDELVDLIATEPRILSYLDMPLQHGSDAMLKAMRRPERRASILERVSALRARIPDLTLRTTVIVGFPGETDRDFRELLDLLEEVRFDRVGAFPYSVEEGTHAAAMDGHLPDSLKRERLEELLDVQRTISLDKTLSQVGRRTRLLIDEAVSDSTEFSWVGRTETQAFDVDGVTFLNTMDDENFAIERGAFVDVEVVDATEHDLIAQLATP